MARQSHSDSPTATATKPKKVRWYQQFWQAYQITQSYDPRTVWFLLGIVVAVVAVFVAVGALTNREYWYWALLGLMFGLLGALILLTRRVEVAAYSQIEGKPGAAYSALSTLRGGWVVGQEPVAIDPRTQDMVFRAVGRPGIVLVSEGPAHRVGRLLDGERKKCLRVAGGAPVTFVQLGNDEGQVPLRRLTRHVGKLKPVLTKQEVAAVDKRLASLGAVRLPVPKGVDPTRVRPDRKGMRGR